ncbi:type I restriction enzyme, S subunit [Dyadobacter koreensis]|uniref:Type I restriction enzyme, S subunit n=1 Tax=Dyadobacter koreensis TaxID=408657 RepID=A0A1H6YWQ6_9BACT|nr:restriction endonuclease subunit S [Dyadobacter koreensis]SEJ41720.1 type I restriction enzyme, S subunit [Dyadobacter koreensis]
MMKKYDKYNESGVKWIKEFPSGWEIVRFKRLAKIKNGKDQKEVSIDEGGYPILGTGGEFGRAFQFIHDKPSVLLGRKGTINKPQFIEEPFWTVDTLFYTEIYDDVNPKYLFYLSQQIPFDLLQESSAVPSMTQEKLNSVYVVKPSLEEQSQIAKYLDHQTAIIDQLIQQKEKLIELLKEKRQSVINEAVTKGLNPDAKMKHSDIEWLGEIPEGWSLTPLKYLASLKGRLGWKGLKAEEYVEKGFGFLSTPDIKNDFIDFNNINFITEARFLESPEIILEVGDVLLVKDGSTLGIVNIIKELPIPSTVNSSIGIIRVVDHNNLSPEYLFWLLKSDYMQVIINRLKSGQGVPHLFQKDIKNFVIILPSLEEQNRIVNHIQQMHNIVNMVIRSTEIQLIKLKEYRQSIVFEAVTGKIDVRDWQPNNPILV